MLTIKGRTTMMGWYGDGGWGWGSWVAMILMMLVLWVGLIAVAVAVARSLRRPGSGEARGMLDERFARGELSEADYQRACDLLGKR